MTPPINRDLSALRPDFRERLERYLGDLRKLYPHLRVNVHETLRTPERQEWLYQQGRVPGQGTPGRFVTWTRESNHLYGIAADWHFTDASGAIWDAALYQEAYKRLPPEDYDLETLAPKEWVHVQLKDADKRREWQPEERRLKVHVDGQVTHIGAIPAGKRVVVALEPDGSVNIDIR